MLLPVDLRRPSCVVQKTLCIRCTENPREFLNAFQILYIIKLVTYHLPIYDGTYAPLTIIGFHSLPVFVRHCEASVSEMHSGQLVNFFHMNESQHTC